MTERLAQGLFKAPWRKQWVSVVVLLLFFQAGWAQGSIFSCVDGKGRRLTSDRPIMECADREQRVLNQDGSTRQVVGPSLTAEERAAAEDAQRRRQVAESARKDAIRHDRNLMNRYPDERAHARAREGALETMRRVQKSSESRLVELDKESKSLQDEAEFYKGRELPAKLKERIEFNQASSEAQKTLVQNHRAEVQRITAIYDEELARLRRLWAGAAPGAMPLPSAAASN
jgi:hypothetical protein